MISDCLSLNPAKRPTAVQIYKAAQAQQYPLRSHKKFIIAWAALFTVAISSYFIFKPADEIPSKIYYEDTFRKAQVLVNSADVDSLKKGLAILDTLSANGYVPALYEQAFTYGWYPDSASLARKDLLDIDYYTDGKSECMPISYDINNKAITYLTVIGERNDSIYPELNAQALYRLAVYYCNENEMYKQRDIDKARGLLLRALGWAQIANDDRLIQKITNNLNIIQNNKQSK